MITPDEIKKKALRIWNSGRFLTAWCSANDLFPLQIPFGKVRGSYISNNYHEVNQGIEMLTASSKQKTGSGYSIEFSSISHRQLGKQNIPEKILIETENDFLILCGKKKEHKIFTEIFFKTKKSFPGLCDFIRDNPLTVIKHASQWEKLLKICLFFQKHPEPLLYIRQIVIPGIDTKFIELNKKILSELLIYLQPVKDKNPPPGLAQHGFEKYFGFLYDESQIRFRILDEEFFIQGLSDLSIPMSQFSALELPVDKVFVTENKINGLSFPMIKKSMVIFGLGYGIQVLREIPWLRDRKIYYWGDIDTHGFSILSIVREILPQCRSFLMDGETLMAHRESWVKETEGKRFTGDLPGLDADEIRLFEQLRNNSYGKNVRLEQELIGFDSLLEVLKEKDLLV